MSFPEQLCYGIVHGYHPKFPVGLYHAGYLMGLPLPDKIAHGRVRMKHFKGCHASLSVASWKKLLGNDSFQHMGKLHPDLLLLFRRKVPEKYQAAVNTACFVLLMGVMLLVTLKDVGQLFLREG